MRWKYLILFAFISFALATNEDNDEHETDVEVVSEVAEVPVDSIEQDTPDNYDDNGEEETVDSEKGDDLNPDKEKESEIEVNEDSEKKEVEEAGEEMVVEDNVQVNEDVVDIEATPKTKTVPQGVAARGRYINFDDYWAAEAVDFGDQSYNWNGESTIFIASQTIK